MNEIIVLVNQDDVSLGPIEKLEAHKKGLLHRAFSVFIFNSKGELLIQQRADEKYHSAGLWANTCCSHPNHGENILNSIHRRMREEMGMVADVDFKFKFTYKALLENKLTEHEIDHVYFGFSNNEPMVNPEEVKNWKYIKMEDLQNELNTHPENYTSWLKICFPEVLSHFKAIVF